MGWDGSMSSREWNTVLGTDRRSMMHLRVSGTAGNVFPRPEEVGADEPGAAAAFCMGPSSIQK
eukprot:13160486-Alexandrium_andersonii.AAC.1